MVEICFKGYKKNFNEIRKVANVGIVTLRKRINNYYKLRNNINKNIISYSKDYKKKLIKKRYIIYNSCIYPKPDRTANIRRYLYTLIPGSYAPIKSFYI